MALICGREPQQRETGEGRFRWTDTGSVGHGEGMR